MRLLLLIAAVIALATAKPEMYKENEDFQYSRSSSDEGHKSGYYGAQRGNMGGNYEKAHNMDPLAQHQMSGLVSQVEGELGDGANTKSGSVFTSANSRGIYGSGRYDTSNLAGRNFNEGLSVGDSHSLSSLSSHNAHSSQYSGQASHHSGYAGSHGLSSGHHADSLHSGNMQAAENVGAGGYDYERNAEHSSGYQSQSGYTKQSSHGYGSNAYTGSNAQTRLVGNGVPARVVIRPGTTVYIPVAAQTYQHASLHDQNTIDTDAEVLSSADHHAHYSPSNDAKSYESSYSYRKEWEKQHGYPSAVPLAVPTISPYPKNSELYEDTQALSGSHNALSSSHYDRYNSNVKSSSAMQSHHQSGFNAAHGSASSLHSNAHTRGALNSDIGYAGDVSSKPKGYQSSYAYHKSWERQGDPYVIIPGNEGQSSGKLIDASDQYGSHSNTKGGKLCCVDADGHIRVARSYDQNQETENLNQQSQKLEDFVQQTQDLPYQSASNLNEHLEDFGQQTQDLTQQSQTNWKQNLEDLGQQTQDLTQQYQTNWKQNLEDFGQQTQDLTQQTQTNWKQNLDDLSQQTQDLGQQTENRWDKLTDPGQQTESQQTQDTWNTHILGHKDLGQHFQNTWKHDEFGQPVQGSWHHTMDRQNTSQEKELHSASNNVNNFHHTALDSYNFSQQNNWQQAILNLQEHNFDQETQGIWHKLDESNKNTNDQSNSQVKPVWEQTEDNIPYFSGNKESGSNNTRHTNLWKFLENDNRNTHTNHKASGTQLNDRTESRSQGKSIVNLWDKINNLDQFSMSDNNKHNGYQNSHGQSILDNSFQNNWSHSYSHHSSDSGLSQSTYMQNQYGTTYGEFKPMLNSNTLNKKTSTEKPSSDFQVTDSLTQNTYHINSFDGYQRRDSTTTEKPVEALRPQDIGRGDIGPEESSIHRLTTTTKPQVNTNHDYLNPSTVSYAFENRKYKTPEEIETLSLTTKTEKIATNERTSLNNKKITEYNSQQQESDSTLTVVSLQELHNEQTKHDNNQNYSSGKSSTTTPKSGSTYNNHYFINQQLESHQLGSQTENTINYNKPTTSSRPVSVSQYKPKEVTDRTPKDLKHLHEEQDSEDMAQKTQQLGVFGSFLQENKNFNQELDQQNQQLESHGKFDQQSENSDQQVQSGWGHGLVGLGQQQQSGWESRDQVQETQQLEKSGRYNEGQYQTQDFYNQRYTTNDKEQKDNSKKFEDLLLPQSPEKIEEMQTITKSKADREMVVPTVPNAENPGFWKSVGNKFSSAKDTVSSWFKKSQ